MLIASRIAWYVFILRVSRPPTMVRVGESESSSAHVMPGVRNAVSRFVLRMTEVATDGRWPPAGGGSTVELALRAVRARVIDFEAAWRGDGRLERSIRERWLASKIRDHHRGFQNTLERQHADPPSYLGPTNYLLCSCMENDSTFVAPEGVYSVTDDYKPNQQQNIAVSIGPVLFPSKISGIVLRFPPPKHGGAPGFAQLLGGGKSEPKKDKSEKVSRDRDDVSLSSSDTPDESEQKPPSSQEHNAGNASISHEHHTLFSHPPAGGKKKAIARPKHNIRTTSSTFITRIQTAEGLAKTLQSKQGDVPFIFYNLAKSFVWIEAGSKAKVYTSDLYRQFQHWFTPLLFP